MNEVAKGAEYRDGLDEIDPSPFRLMPLPPLCANPLVSVIISNYNYARFLPAVIQSVLDQTYQNVEVIVSDDGSTDDSREVLESLKARDARVKAVYKENGGQVSAWNVAYMHAGGQVICFLDADDRCTPHRVANIVAAFREHSRAGICRHQLLPVDERGEVLSPPFPGTLESGWLATSAERPELWGQMAPSSALALRREIADKLFPLSDDLRVADMYLQYVAQFFTEVVGIEEPLTHYLIHGANDSASRIPTVSTLQTWITLDEEMFAAARSWLTTEYGQPVADKLRILDIRMYVENLLALYILEHMSYSKVRGFQKRDLLAALHGTRRRWIWGALTMLPRPLARRLFEIWWGKATWKRYVRGVARALGLH